MRILPRQRLTRQYYAGIEKGVAEAFRSFIFAPVAIILRSYNPQIKATSLLNEVLPDALLKALDSGQIQYKHGVFAGKFNAATVREIVRLGGKFNSRLKVFLIDDWNVPPYVKMRAALYQTTAKTAHVEILQALDQMERVLREDGDKLEIFHIGSMGLVEHVDAGCRKTTE